MKLVEDINSNPGDNLTRIKLKIAVVMDKLNGYYMLETIGDCSYAMVPDGFKKIRAHIAFDVNQDRRHKVCLAADGHLTKIPLESVYSSEVSLRGFRLIVFAAALWRNSDDILNKDWSFKELLQNLKAILVGKEAKALMKNNGG